MTLVRWLRRIVSLLGLLSLLGVHKPAPAPVYVPGPHNKYVPKPSCATVENPKDKRHRRTLAVCATTHGLVVKGPYASEKAAGVVADAIYDAELAAQGGQLRP